jgi:chitodextrinase
MRRSGASNAIAAGLLVAGILIGMAGFYVATPYRTRTLTQTETATARLTTTATETLPTTMTDVVTMVEATTLNRTVTSVNTVETSTVSSETGGPLLYITFHPTPTAEVERLNLISTVPVTVAFKATPPGPSPFTYSWNFGDGTGSSSPTATHVFPTGCVYDVTLKVVDGQGNVTSETMLFSLFTSRGAAGEMDLCPQRGTAGITTLELSGGFYGLNETLRILLDNSSLTNTTTDSMGDWALNVTSSLPPLVNGSLYTFTTSPDSVASSFLTLEGIRASPSTGEPGDSFTLEGRSYPANTTVSIYLGGVLLGRAQSDENGTFLASLQIPSSLSYPGTYQFTTSPPVLGASANFSIVPNPADALDGQPVSAKDLSSLQQASLAAYGEPGQSYLSSVHTLTGLSEFTKDGIPILVYVGADYCPYCAIQRWSLIMALMRFGNFTGLEYMTSALDDGDYATFTFSNSTYHSNYLVFQPFELYNRTGVQVANLPANYTSTFQQYGESSFPFLNFADAYYVSGSILDPSILGTMNQTQVISAILAGNPAGSEIRQAANLITAVICETTGNKPSSVCDNPSITALKGTLVSYTIPPTNSSSLLLLPDSTFETTGRP